jgi:gas vesicle protein
MRPDFSGISGMTTAATGAGLFVAGAACGLAIGAALGLLFAPKPGHELRQQMSESAERMKRKATEVYDSDVYMSKYKPVFGRVQDHNMVNGTALSNDNNKSAKLIGDIGKQNFYFLRKIELKKPVRLIVSLLGAT